MPGATTGKSGSQTEIATATSYKPYGKAGKLVKVKQGIKLELEPGEQIVKSSYNYIAKSTGKESQGNWNGRGVLSFKRDNIQITDVFVWAKLPHHPPYNTVTL